MLVHLDPDDPEAEDAERQRVEDTHLPEIAEALSAAQRELNELLASGRLSPTDMQRLLTRYNNNFDQALGQALRDVARQERSNELQQQHRYAIGRTVDEAAATGLDVAFRQLGNVGISLNYGPLNYLARDWAQRYSYELITRIDVSTGRQVGHAVSSWMETGEHLDLLIRQLEPVFGRNRAEMIAATETTRAFAEGTLLGYRQSGQVEATQWKTARDERVCDICRPLHGIRGDLQGQFVHPGGIGRSSRHEGRSFRAPAHVRCRCAMAPIVIEAAPRVFPVVTPATAPEPVSAPAAAPAVPAVTAPQLSALDESTLMTQMEALTERIRAAEDAGDDAAEERLSAERRAYFDEITKRRAAGTWRGESGAEAAERRRRAAEVAFLQTAEGQRQAAADRAAVARAGTTYQPTAETLRAVSAYIDEQVARAAPQLGPRIGEADLTPERMKSLAYDALVDLVAERDVAIQFRSQLLDSLLDTGRYRTQFETGTTGGTLDKKARTQAEATGIGIPTKIDPRLRPVYGYVDFGADSFHGNVGGYGDITLVMRPEVRARSTVTVGDSLYGMKARQVAATPLEAPLPESMDTLIGPLYQYARRGDLRGLINNVDYLEVQIQGGVTVEDIAFVRDQGGKLTEAQVAALGERGIAVIREAGGRP